MSMNIDRVLIIKGELSISKESHMALSKKLNSMDKVPELNIFDCPWRGDSQKIIYNTENPIQWGGEGSGYCEDSLLDEVLPAMKGTADIVIVWEGGEGIEGVRVKGGAVTRHEVKYVLED